MIIIQSIMGNHKYIRIILISIASMIIIILAINAFSFIRFTQLKNSLLLDDCDSISIKDYKTGETVVLDDDQSIDLIMSYINRVSFSGIYTGDQIIYNDSSYISIMFSSPSQLVTIICSDDERKSRVVEGDFQIAIKETSGLFTAAKQLFNNHEP